MTQRIIYDLDSNTVQGVEHTGLTGSISFSRLCEVLEAAGEAKPHERITGFTIVVGPFPAIYYRVEARKP